MGQIGALLYKQWILTRRQRLGLCCEVMTPLFSLLLIWCTLYLAKEKMFDSLPLDKQGDRTDSLLPTYVHAGYTSNPSTQFAAKDHFDNSNPRRILNYWADPSCQQDVKKMFDQKLKFVEFIDGRTGNWSPYLNWTNNMKGTTVSNQELIKQLKTVMLIEEKDFESYDAFSDAVLIFNKTDPNYGMSIHMQMNNLIWESFHRCTGISKLRFKHKKESLNFENFITPTEGYISTMTFLNNKFINRLAEGIRKKPTIFSLISLTADSSAVQGYVESIIGTMSILFFPVALTLGFPLLLFALVLEKEEKVRVLLEVNGLSYFKYWISIYFLYFVLFSLSSTTFQCLGWVFIDAAFFRKVNKIINTLFFVGWNLSQISFGIFLSHFISSAIYANLLGYLLSIIMTLMFSALSFMVFPTPSQVPYLFYIIPHSAYVRFFYSITVDCMDNRCYPDGLFTLQGDSYYSFWALWASIPIYGLLAYLASLIDFESCLRSLQCCSKKKTVLDVADFYFEAPDGEKVNTSIIELPDESGEKMLEGYKEKVDNIDGSDPNYAIVIRHLSKVYPNGKKALDDFSVSIKKNQVFGLLGPNGAGKTTLLSILTGTLKKTTGTVIIEGAPVVYNKRTEKSAAIGYCPQFDILWSNMTVYEHIKFFTLFKEYAIENRENYINSLIRHLGLWTHKDNRISELSGGMKRRVSLGIAVTGEPKVIFLDEPTSGLDPIRRREFWELIKKVGVGKAVVLTTHLMEEADVLSNEIAIMASGDLKCVGSSMMLKEKYSSGMKMQLVAVNSSMKDKVKEEVQNTFLKITPSWEFDRTLNFSIHDSHGKMTKIFELTTRLTKAKLIEDWSIMSGSLEEVFHNVMVKSVKSSTTKIL